MPLAYYIEINVFCVFILLLLLANTSRMTFQSTDQKIFRWIIALTALFCVSDLGTWLFNGDQFFSNRQLCWGFNAVYFISSGILGFFWLLYIVARVTKSMSLIIDRAKIWAIPVVIFVVMVLTSPWTKLIYYLDANDTYTRGAGVFLHWIVSWGYMVAMAIYSLRQAKSEPAKSRRYELYLLSSLCVPPFLGSIVQVLFEGLTTIQVGLTMSILIAFIFFQNRQISRDALTGTNNRSQMERYLTDKMRTAKPEDTIFLMLLDVDDFKSINDSFGHVVGDHALVDVAKILKTVCGRMKSGLFLARYGGDEFAIVGYGLNEEVIPQILESIETETRLKNEQTTEKYRLSISAGCAKGLCKDFRNMDELLEAADNEMYKNKKAKKALK